jgi:osmotically-inducible protein OsmY
MCAVQTLQMKKQTDGEIQRLVLDELRWDPRVHASDVGVQVKQGVVTLTGRVTSLGKQVAAVRAAHRVKGVLGVFDELEVPAPESGAPRDSDLAHAVREALRWNVFVDEGPVHSTVSGGWVTLEGEVSDWFQRDAAVRAVRDLAGVRGLTNLLTVKRPKVEAGVARAAIDSALERRSDLQGKGIAIVVKNGVVKLTGSVRSWPEKRAVERACGFTPGVVRVENQLVIDSCS